MNTLFPIQYLDAVLIEALIKLWSIALIYNLNLINNEKKTMRQNHGISIKNSSGKFK